MIKSDEPKEATQKVVVGVGVEVTVVWMLRICLESGNVLAREQARHGESAVRSPQCR